MGSPMPPNAGPMGIGPTTAPRMSATNSYTPFSRPLGSPEVRHAPHRHRPEINELPPHMKVVKEHQHHIPGYEALPHGSTKFDLYGALEEVDKANLEESLAALKRRRRINCIPALSSLFLPWALFLVVYSLTSFYFHYYSPAITILGNLFVVLCVGSYAYFSYSRKSVGAHEAFYPMYLSGMFLLAVFFGWLLGDLNFWYNMQPVYNIEHLGTYNNVNPSQSKDMSGELVPTNGRRYQDAGKVYFESNAVIDFNKSASFKMGEVFCVAPIVDPNCKKNCGYDFWAVGINCCAEDVADFRCGEYDNPSAKAGMRLMHDDERPNFRLAVLQAEGLHKVVSNHPIFLYWMHDPVREMQHIKRKGFRGFVLLMIISFVGFAVVSHLSLKWAREKFGSGQDDS